MLLSYILRCGIENLVELGNDFLFSQVMSERLNDFLLKVSVLPDLILHGVVVRHCKMLVVEQMLVHEHCHVLL